MAKKPAVRNERVLDIVRERRGVCRREGHKPCKKEGRRWPICEHCGQDLYHNPVLDKWVRR